MENQGSTSREGYLYHEPAFPVLKNIKFHRSDNQHRLNVLITSQNWWNKNVLDLGCNVGYFANKLALEGARTTGVDTDKDAIFVANAQAKEYGLENATFLVPGQDRKWMTDKDVLVAFSVIPWIYATEKDPDAYCKKLFQIPTAYVEIQYPPDGRASVPGVTDDASCKKWLEKFYGWVVKIGETIDETEGVRRERSIWKCLKDLPEDAETIIYGSQATVEFTEHAVSKKQREGKTYDPKKEAEFLEQLAPYNIAPKYLGQDDQDEHYWMTRIYGKPLTTGLISYERLENQISHILEALAKTRISHNDIRPANLIIGNDKNVYLIDYGWATKTGDQKPEGVNPVFGTDDLKAFQKILELYKHWEV